MPEASVAVRTRRPNDAAGPPEGLGPRTSARPARVVRRTRKRPPNKWRAFDPRDEDEGMTAAVPTVHQACWPLTSYSAREPDPGSPVSNLLESNVRVRFRDRRPRDLLVRSRVGVGGKVRPVRTGGQWHPCPSPGVPKVGRVCAPPRDGRTRCVQAPRPPAGGDPQTHSGDARDTLWPCPDPPSSAAACSPVSSSRW
jgi:hypothetical protein